jgi:hypothetical protein
MKESFALIFATLALSMASVGLMIQFGIINVMRSKPDKYEKFRNTDGLLGRKKE